MNLVLIVFAHLNYRSKGATVPLNFNAFLEKELITKKTPQKKTKNNNKSIIKVFPIYGLNHQ